ncbi:MAG: hypothetical protein QNJ64_02725 [Crocosphaera sp.]|nr:hypothetical protein [Crocosphaera sp.]
MINVLWYYRNNTKREIRLMFVGTTEAAKRLGISASRLRVLLQEGRVEGAYKAGKMWLIPLYNGVPVIAKRQRGRKPQWTKKQVPAKNIIHVNRNMIHKNHDLMQENPQLVKNKADIAKLDPVLSTKNYKENIYAHEIKINGPCRLVYRPDVPKCFGATVWIETLSSVEPIKYSMI